MNDLRFILVRPRNPGNLGCIARTLKNFGFKRLDLAAPRLVHPEEATDWACGADELIKHARRFDSLKDAIADCRSVVGTSGRPIGVDRQTIPPQSLGSFLQSASTPTAIVFGPEQSGLKNEELALCQQCVHIPTCPEFSSMNLAQSVALLAWEARRSLLMDQAEFAESRESAMQLTAGELQAFYDQAEQALLELDFFQPENRQSPMQTIRRVFDRAELSSQELRFLRGIFRQIRNQESILRARLRDEASQSKS